MAQPVSLSQAAISAAQAEAIAKAARIFTNSLITVVREMLPTGSAADKMQLIVTLGIQSATKGAALAFDDAASAGLDAELFEALVTGMGSGVGTKLGALDPLSREYAMRSFLTALHGGIAAAAQPEGQG